MRDEHIPPVNYTGDIPCQCCGTMMHCDKCEDPKVAELIHHLLWETDLDPDDPANGAHGVHLCGWCEEAGCNFDEPNGEGEHCGDAPVIEDPFNNFGDEQ